MPIPDVGAAEVAAGVNAHAHPFSGRVVHRQVRRPHAHALWDPGFGPYRWNSGFPALYASLSLDFALAERIKRTLARPVDPRHARTGHEPCDLHGSPPTGRRVSGDRAVRLHRARVSTLMAASQA